MLCLQQKKLAYANSWRGTRMKIRTKRILILLCFIVTLGACTAEENKTQNDNENGTIYSADIFAMDTYMTLSAYGEKAETAVSAAVEEVNRLDTLLSVSSEKGDIYYINQNGGGQVSEETAELIIKAKKAFTETDGAFDCTIAPVMEAWGFRSGNFCIPEAEELSELLQKVDSSKILIEGTEVSLPDGVSIDLGGIAKGYTSHQIMEIYRENGITSGIVSLGGNVETLGTKPDGSLWRIALQDPENTEEYFAVLEVADRAIITSGGYQRNFIQDGEVYHHIIDPVTGFPAQNGLISVTIVSKDGTLADVLSTSLFVMGTEKAVNFWRQHKDEFDAVMMTEDRRVLVTEGIMGVFTPLTNDSVEVLS